MNGDAAFKTFSFDVFDTCVTRRCAYPVDVFYELGLRLAPAGARSVTQHRFAKAFQAARIDAERRARHTLRSPAALCIYDIYSAFVGPPGLRLTTPELVQAECELEGLYIYAIPATVRRINELRALGKRVIFTSDMYLPRPILKPILMHCGVMHSDDSLYVSCDFGAEKSNGSLFRLVLEKEGLLPGDILHYGDNVGADVIGPARVGVEGRRLDAGVLTKRERSVARPKRLRTSYDSWLSGLCRQLRVHAVYPPKLDRRLASSVDEVIVPFLLTYVNWALTDARKRGLRRLYFVSRDGEVLLKIASKFVRPRSELELRYLRGSRRAWLAASVEPNNVDWLKSAVVCGQSNSRADVLARLGFGREGQERIRRELAIEPTDWGAPLSIEGATKFAMTLVHDNKLERLVLEKRDALRRTVLAYFKKEGLLDDVPWAIVDSGWALNAQAALKRILHRANPLQPTPRGYYIGLGSDHLTTEQAGYACPFIATIDSMFARRRVVVEHCFLAPTDTTTIGYRALKNGVEPIFGPELRTSSELAYAEYLQFAAETAAGLGASDPLFSSFLSRHATTVARRAQNLLRYPTVEQAEALRCFHVVSDMRHEDGFATPLCRSLRWPDIAWMLLGAFVNSNRSANRPIAWLEGSAAASPFLVRHTAQILIRVSGWLRARPMRLSINGADPRGGAHEGGAVDMPRVDG